MNQELKVLYNLKQNGGGMKYHTGLFSKYT